MILVMLLYIFNRCCWLNLDLDLVDGDSHGIDKIIFTRQNMNLRMIIIIIVQRLLLDHWNINIIKLMNKISRQHVRFIYKLM